MWHYEHTVETAATLAAIWDLWSDLTTWPAWDEGITWARLDGPFAVGTAGELCPQGGDPLPFVLTDVTPGVGFADEMQLPGATLRFEHEAIPGEHGTVVTHRVSIAGPAAEQLAGMGAGIAAGIPATMARLAELASTAGRPA